MPAVETTGLTKRYGDVVALSDLSLSVADGELFGLLGPNGSGKTATIEILTGQREPTGGSVSVLGKDPVTDPLSVRAAIGILPEREDPPSFLTPREYLQFVGDVRDIDDIEDPPRSGRGNWSSVACWTRSPVTSPRANASA
jgi:ABC-2 type transport system ATP-binding protein